MHNWLNQERGAVMKAWSQFEKMIEQTNSGIVVTERHSSKNT